MLTPVSFRTGRQSQPRLSEPYVPGHHHARYWTGDEIAVMREYYADRGAAYCLTLLPGRRLSGVYGQAGKMGLQRLDRAPRSKAIGTSINAAILERWPTLKGRGAVAALATELGVGRHIVSDRALALGLTLPHRKEPRWTEAEEELLRRAPVNNPEAASKFFAAHGFRRSPASIMVRCKRLGVSRRRTDVLSGRGAARILGVDDKTFTTWCHEGLVVAERRGTRRLPQQGGDVWTIRPNDLRRFVLEQLDRLDIRKVDKHAFVALLAGAAALDASAMPGAGAIRALAALHEAVGNLHHWLDRGQTTARVSATVLDQASGVLRANPGLLELPQ